MRKTTRDWNMEMIGTGLQAEVDKLVDHGIFDNRTEIAREAIRDIIIKYKKLRK